MPINLYLQQFATLPRHCPLLYLMCLDHSAFLPTLPFAKFGVIGFSNPRLVSAAAERWKADAIAKKALGSSQCVRPVREAWV